MWVFWSPVSEPTKTPEELLLEEADALYAQDETDKLYDLLRAHKASNNADILWRLARAACDKGKHAGKDPEKKNFMFEAFEYIKRAKEANDDNFAVHKVGEIGTFVWTSYDWMHIYMYYK